MHSSHILQAPVHCASILATDDHPSPLTIVGVYLNGAPLKFRALGASTVATCGLSEADLGDFYSFCKANHKRALRDAVTKQVRDNSVAGYRGLVDQYFRVNPPSLNAVKAGVLQTRQHGDAPEVLLDGCRLGRLHGSG